MTSLLPLELWEEELLKRQRAYELSTVIRGLNYRVSEDLYEEVREATLFALGVGYLYLQPNVYMHPRVEIITPLLERGVMSIKGSLFLPDPNGNLRVDYSAFHFDDVKLQKLLDQPLFRQSVVETPNNNNEVQITLRWYALYMTENWAWTPTFISSHRLVLRKKQTGKEFPYAPKSGGSSPSNLQYS